GEAVQDILYGLVVGPGVVRAFLVRPDGIAVEGPEHLPAFDLPAGLDPPEDVARPAARLEIGAGGQLLHRLPDGLPGLDQLAGRRVASLDAFALQFLDQLLDRVRGGFALSQEDAEPGRRCDHERILRSTGQRSDTEEGRRSL